MSSPSEPVGIVSISTAFWFLPRRMIEPLPKARSICESAASRALVLSTKVPSTTRRLAGLTALSPSLTVGVVKANIARSAPLGWQCTRFVLVGKFFFCSRREFTAYAFYALPMLCDANFIEVMSATRVPASGDESQRAHRARRAAQRLTRGRPDGECARRIRPREELM